jgi:hypothetical protein
MKSISLQNITRSQMYFGGMCLVVIVWATVTFCMELHMGFPSSRAEWGHRLIGWFLNYLLITKFAAGTRHYYSRIRQEI